MKKSAGIPEIIAALGLLASFLHARYYALTQFSVLDEGAYLLKGLWFVRGEFTPFQDYGPLTNHMPLSFLLHGWVQTLFGPGLLAGRGFALVMGVLLAAGLWFLVRQLRGPWWAALAVWLLALNPATARFYSLATSQAIIAALLVWTLVLALPAADEEKVPAWRTTLAAVLAAVMMLIRLNLAPVLVLLVPFIFWVHGRRAGWQALGAGLAVLLAGHVLFWPGILKIWSYWLPESLTPFLDPWRQPTAARFWDPQVTFSNRLFSFLEGMRLHFLAVMGFVLALFYFPDPRKSRSNRSLFFAAVLFAVLLLEHALASLALSYCVYCFPVYMAFFTPLGLFLLAGILPGTFKDADRGRRFTLAVFIVLFSLALGFGAFDQVGDALARIRLPRIRSWLGGDPAPGLPVWDVLETRFGLAYATSKRLLPALAGLGIGLLALAAGVLLRRRDLRLVSLHVFLLTGLVLTPTAVLGDGFRTYDCGPGTVAHLETVGAELAGWIEPGDQVYWRGGDSIVPLLYVPGAVVYPAQVNGDYTIFALDDADRLIKFGLWSEEISNQWLRAADIVLVEAARYQGDFEDAVDGAGLVRAGQTDAAYRCLDGTEILVFKRP